MAAYSNMPNIEILELTHEYVKFMLRNTDSSYAFPPSLQERQTERVCVVLCCLYVCGGKESGGVGEREGRERMGGVCSVCSTCV